MPILLTQSKHANDMQCREARIDKTSINLWGPREHNQPNYTK